MNANDWFSVVGIPADVSFRDLTMDDVWQHGLPRHVLQIAFVPGVLPTQVLRELCYWRACRIEHILRAVPRAEEAFLFAARALGRPASGDPVDVLGLAACFDSVYARDPELRHSAATLHALIESPWASERCIAHSLHAEAIYAARFYQHVESSQRVPTALRDIAGPQIAALAEWVRANAEPNFSITTNG